MKANLKTKFRPAPQYFYRSENIMGIDDVERTLSVVEIDSNICSECYHMTFTNKCEKCARQICDACSDWTFKKVGRGKKRVRVIDVKCPCRRLLYNDFY